jgi:hypothetical protein
MFPGPLFIVSRWHYEERMSKVFFDELDCLPPEYNLGILGLSYGAMAGRVLEEIEWREMIECGAIFWSGRKSSTLLRRINGRRTSNVASID